MSDIQERSVLSLEVPRVYIVDDEWVIAETLAIILERAGFRVQAFHDSNRALVRALSCPPDVLITDVMMPGMTGVELAIALRRAGCECRILLFSGETGAIDLLCDARRRGYDFELLSKPLHPMQLMLRLRNIKRWPGLPDASTPEDSGPEADPGSQTQPAA